MISSLYLYHVLATYFHVSFCPLQEPFSDLISFVPRIVKSFLKVVTCKAVPVDRKSVV